MPLDTFPYSIGRRSACNLQVLGPDVSREHAVIEQCDGSFVICDRGSRFGMFVNGQTIMARRQLAHGDRIRPGRTDTAELAFLTHDEALARASCATPPRASPICAR